MIEGIDHIVILVEELDTAVAGAVSAGFTVTPGGQHRAGSTHNALIGFADGTYLELLAFTSPPDPAHYFADRVRRGPGFADFALRSSDIDHDVDAIAAAGMTFPLPTHLSRQRPDGEIACWRMSLPQVLEPGTAFPFLMQDLTPRTRRVPTEPGQTTHANGAQGMVGLTVVVQDLPAYQHGLQTILQAGPANDGSHFRETRGVVQIPLTPDGLQSLAILQPTANSVPERHLARFGSSIYAVNLRTTPNDTMKLGTGELLDMAALGGARIYLQS